MVNVWKLIIVISAVVTVTVITGMLVSFEHRWYRIDDKCNLHRRVKLIRKYPLFVDFEPYCGCSRFKLAVELKKIGKLLHNSVT